MIHLSNNFISSKVHAELIGNLADSGNKQYVMVPVRHNFDIGKNYVKHDNVEIDYIIFNNKVLRYLPLVKIFYVFWKCLRILRERPIEDLNRAQSTNCIAHNFWSDGMVIFLLSFFVKLRYVLIVRNTDISIFIPRLPYHRWLMKRAIRRSQGLVFVNQSYFARFWSRWPDLLDKSTHACVVPNGISDFWHKHRVTSHGDLDRGIYGCFVGRFDHNKNLKRVIEATERVVKIFPSFRLILAGGGKAELQKFLGKKEIPDFVDVRGLILDNLELMKIYRQSRVLVMPSITETFGLVYLEALSQGCSVVCTRNEGIDGLFESSDVVAVNPYSVDEIELALSTLLQRNSRGVDPFWVSTALERYDWREVAGQYMAFFE